MFSFTFVEGVFLRRFLKQFPQVDSPKCVLGVSPVPCGRILSASQWGLEVQLTSVHLSLRWATLCRHEHKKVWLHPRAFLIMSYMTFDAWWCSDGFKMLPDSSRCFQIAPDAVQFCLVQSLQFRSSPALPSPVHSIPFQFIPFH